jgi:hypothetical protein
VTGCAGRTSQPIVCLRSRPTAPNTFMRPGWDPGQSGVDWGDRAEPLVLYQMYLDRPNDARLMTNRTSLMSVCDTSADAWQSRVSDSDDAGGVCLSCWTQGGEGESVGLHGGGGATGGGGGSDDGGGAGSSCAPNSDDTGGTAHAAPDTTGTTGTPKVVISCTLVPATCADVTPADPEGSTSSPAPTAPTPSTEAWRNQLGRLRAVRRRPAATTRARLDGRALVVSVQLDPGVQPHP